MAIGSKTISKRIIPPPRIHRNSTPEYILTIVVPVYNEEECLIKFKDEMDRFLNLSSLKTKVLFVNDGSHDNSLKIIKDICSTSGDYYFASLGKNSGLSAAINAGMDLCDTRLFGYIDADLQTSPLDFLSFFPHLDNYQMVNGIRSKRIDTLTRRITSKVANIFRRTMIKDGIEDTCCPLKIINTAMVKKLPFFNGLHRFLPALVQLYGGKVKQVEVSHCARYAGTAKYNTLNRFFGPFFDTLAFMWMRKRVIRYKIVESLLVHE